MGKVATTTCNEGSRCQVHGKVIGAWYGALGYEWTSNHGQDVTAKVIELLAHDSAFNATRAIFGDPAPWTRKILVFETIDEAVIQHQASPDPYHQPQPAVQHPVPPIQPTSTQQHTINYVHLTLPPSAPESQPVHSIGVDAKCSGFACKQEDKFQDFW